MKPKTKCNRWICLKHAIMSVSLERILSLGLKFQTPQRQLMSVYVGYSLLGTLLLLLPCSTTRPVHIVDHLFTVVSAFSTTGLTTVDISSEYTFFGQLVILLLIQLGGLGYMTLSSYVMLRLTHRLGSEKAKLFNMQFAYPNTIDSESMLRSIVNFTFCIELLGVILLLPYFLIHGVEHPLWSAVFHSVSAFCTAGFSIYSNNLMAFQTDTYVNIVIIFLCYAGAMGFIMMTDLFRKLRKRSYQVTFTTKVIFTVTALLTIWSTFHLFFFEISLQKYDIFDRLMIALFQSMSAMTTTGYNTVDVTQMLPLSFVILSFCMYIGASPSGTGGGLKSTTLSAVYAYTKNKLGLHDTISLRGNIIPSYRVETAITTIFFYTFILLVGIYALLLFEYGQTDFLHLVFEASSALATTGLTSGILSHITLGSKLVLIVLMYIGRVGVLTMGNALLMRSSNPLPKRTSDMAV